MFFLKNIRKGLDAESIPTLDHKLSVCEKINPMDVATFHSTFSDLMGYPLIKDGFIVLTVLENYTNGDKSVAPEIVKSKVIDIILRSLGIHPVGPVDKNGIPEFGWRCYEALSFHGALTLQQNLIVFKSVLVLFEQSDLWEN